MKARCDIDGLVKDLMYSHPEFYQPLKSELDAKYHIGTIYSY